MKRTRCALGARSSGLRVHGSVPRVQCSVRRVPSSVPRVPCSEFRAQSSVLRVQGSAAKAQSSRLGVQGQRSAFKAQHPVNVLLAGSQCATAPNFHGWRARRVGIQGKRPQPCVGVSPSTRSRPADRSTTASSSNAREREQRNCAWCGHWRQRQLILRSCIRKAIDARHEEPPAAERRPHRVVPRALTSGWRGAKCSLRERHLAHDLTLADGSKVFV